MIDTLNITETGQEGTDLKLKWASFLVEHKVLSGKFDVKIARFHCFQKKVHVLIINHVNKQITLALISQ